MQNLEHKRVAIVCDWIKDWGGAEIVLEQLLEAFPTADIFSSVFFQNDNPLFKNRKITTSFIQNIPFLNKYHKLALTLRPRAFESFDMSKYDIVISSTSAESKGVITKPNTIHICYCHTPTRYFWSHYHEYINYMEFGLLNPFAKWLMPKIIYKLRAWDFVASKRPDYFIANSQNTAARISKYYKRESKVIYPCINTSDFEINTSSQQSEKREKADFYLYIGRCIPYKKFDLVVNAFNKNGKKIIICTNTDNRLYRQLKSISKGNIEWKLNLARKEITRLYSQAKAFVFPPEEDFGLVPLEAMASGNPVIAYAKGGALETVLEGETGTFFKNQTSNSLNKAIEKFETMKFDPKKIREHAMKFDKEIFKRKILSFVQKKLK